MNIFKSLFGTSKDTFSELYKLEAKVELATSALEIMSKYAKELADIDSRAGDADRADTLYSMHKNGMDVVTRLKS